MAGRIFHAPLIRAVPELSLASLAGRADAASLIADPDIDLIVVATPNDSHVDLAEQALHAGKHVIVDKPFALDADAGERLIELASRQGKMLTVFHNRRWDGDFLTTYHLLKSERLGLISLFEAHWDRFRPQVPGGWREDPNPGAGTLWNLVPHLIDQLLLLFGMPNAVHADIVCQRSGARVDDYFSLTFHYDAMRAVVSASNLIAIPRPRFSVHGTEGSYVKYGLDPQEQALAGGTDPLVPGFGEEAEEQHGRVAFGAGAPRPTPTQPGCYLDFYRGVASAILEGGPVPVDPLDAVAGLRLIEAARASAACGELVRLPVARSGLGPMTG
jgi:scyllo-inositol 2-dehydrogenase (NADP+)